jgi:sugar/nucleoside kinase (ribokinase family)
MHSLFGVENPLMDVIAHVDAAFLERFGKHPGTMHLVEHRQTEELLAAAGPVRTLAGGSAANTARGYAWLRGPAGRAFWHPILGGEPAPEALLPPVFNGAIGRDARGDEFERALAEAGVAASLARKPTPTGTSVILVTPDGERTMNTFLGACRDFTVEDLDRGRLGSSRMLYLTAYLWDTDNQRRVADEAAAAARERGVGVALDLADPFAVKRFGDPLRAWIPGRVDVLFGNRDEIALLTGGGSDEECVRRARALAPLVAMKVGARGCLVAWEGGQAAVPGVKASVADTTGAGDAFAAGFLFGRLAGARPEACARLANALAARVVGVEGCVYSG